MIRKNLFILPFLLLSLLPMDLAAKLYFDHSTFELRTAAFIHARERFRDIYGDVGPSLSLEYSRQFDPSWQFFINHDITYQQRKKNFCLDTSLSIFNVSFGFKKLYFINYHTDWYFGFGPSVSWVNLKDATFDCSNRYSRIAYGAVFKLGVHHRFNEKYFSTLFSDFLYQHVRAGRHSSIGGYKVGIGVGRYY